MDSKDIARARALPRGAIITEEELLSLCQSDPLFQLSGERVIYFYTFNGVSPGTDDYYCHNNYCVFVKVEDGWKKLCEVFYTNE